MEMTATWCVFRDKEVYQLRPKQTVEAMDS